MARPHCSNGMRGVTLAAATIALLIPGISFPAPPPSRAELEADKLSIEVEKLKAEVAAMQNEASPTKAQLEKQKLQNEIQKLQAEVEALQTSKTGPWYLLPWIQAVGLGSLIGAGVVYWAGRRLSAVQAKKLLQDVDLAMKDHGISRSQHNLELFKALGDAEPRVRLGAASELGQRVRELKLATGLPAPEWNEMYRERQTIIRVLIAVTKYEDKSEELQKHIADLIADILEAFQSDLPKSPLEEYDFQGARLTNAWWKGVDARKTDFYKAGLARAGLANSRLSKAVFKKADLRGATLREVDGVEANFEGANLSDVRAEGANLEGADLRDAIVTGADFSNARLRGAKLQGVDLQSAKTCAGADLRDVETDSRTRLP
jgi:hypothetical protein